MKTGIVLPFPVYENAVSSAFFDLFIRGRWLANPKQDGNRWSQQVCKAILKRSNVNVCDEKDDLLDVADVILPVLFSCVQYSGEWSNAQSVWPIIWSAQHFCCAPHRSFSAGAVSDYQAPAKPQRVDSHISIGLTYTRVGETTHTLELDSYVAQLKKFWPRKGRHILAQYDDSSVVVYQAYNREIAKYAVENQR